MLDPKSNHIDYCELLKPPAGFILKRAVGTTYSLDLQALLAVPVAMFYSKPLEPDFDKKDAPLDVFDAISNAAKIVTIFCQKGKIKVPRKFNKLICFTEDCVKEITLDNASRYFHSKCWWLWFENISTGEKVVRFAITSRNLTFDRSWDVSFCFEGYVSSINQPQNKPMVDMLNYLNGHFNNTIDGKYKQQLIKTAFVNDLPFKSWNFHPIGIGEEYSNPLLNNNFKPEILMMMSPFIDDKNIEALANKVTSKCWLFSRRTELQKTEPETLELLNKCYCIPEIIVNGEWIDQMADAIPNVEPDFLDLHAKLYISRKGNTNTWLLGSANLTEPAFGRNIECLIEMKTEDKTYSPEAVFKELVSTSTEKKLFEEFVYSNKNGEEEQNELDKILRKLIYNLTCSRLTGEAVHSDDKLYFTYKMVFDASMLHIPNDINVYLQPWSIETTLDYGLLIEENKINYIDFDSKLTESKLSKYFIFTITHKGNCQYRFLVKAEIELPSTRHGKILSEIINSKEKFLQYLQLLLSNSGIVDETEFNQPNINQSGINLYSEGYWAKYGLPLYEELLKAASQHPEKLKNIDELITKLKADESTSKFISPELSELWDVFKQVIK